MKSPAPLLSLNPHGSFAKSIIALRSGRGGVLQKWHKPGGTPTSAQLAVRSKFSLAKDAWNALTTEAKQVYNDRARYLPLTGYNLFISEFKEEMLPYKVYRASISQSDTDAPIVNILENNVGFSIEWTRDDSGVYLGTFSVIQDVSKTFISMNNLSDITADFPNMIALSFNASAIFLYTYQNGDFNSRSDNVLLNTSIELLVYPS